LIKDFNIYLRIISLARKKEGKDMRRNLVPAILLLCLLALSVTALPTSATAKPKVVVHLKGALEPDAQLQAIISNMTWIDWVVELGDLTASDLANAKMLIMVKADAALEYTTNELTAVENWFNTGDKAIWVAGESDYPGDNARIATGNAVLEAIGSVLWFESCETVDPVTNAGADYRVYGISTNCDPEVSFLVAGVTNALFHGPGAIIGYYDGEYHKLEVERPSNVFIVMTSSETGTIAEYTEPISEAHTVGDTGMFPLLVVEVDYAKKNVIIASADAPFDHYTGMYMPEIYGIQRYVIDYPQQGATLFKNLLDYALYYAGPLMTQHNQIATLEDQVTSLGGQITSLQGEVTTLQGNIATLQGQITTCQETVANLEDQVTAAQGSVTMWQGVAVALLIVGLVIGVAVVYFMKK
jgi:hypothetical protein